MRYEARQRLFDLCISIVVLAMLWPVIVVLAIWIRVDSSGPSLFQQERVGFKGEHFKIFKFRTMRSLLATENNIQITNKNNDRITQLGSALRKSKLDELPQLFNVLMGHMSIVGPRPEVPKYASQYSQSDYETLISMRPGISDPTSLEFINEEEILAEYSDDEIEYAYINEIVPKKMTIVRDYGNNRSICSDIKVSVNTVFIILKNLKA